MLVATGYFPPNIEFGNKELATVVHVLNEQNKEARRGRHR